MPQPIFYSILALFFCSLLGAQGPAPDTSPSLQDERRWLAARGLDVEAVWKADLVAVPSGGADHGTAFLSNLDLLFDFDLQRAGLWDGGRAWLYLLDNRGDEPTALVGDLQATSNIEADSTFKVYEAYYEHSFLAGRASILAGLHDYSSEFYVVDSAAPFLHSSLGIGPELSQLPPSIFPTTSLAARLRLEPVEDFYLQYAVYDGVPGNPRDVHGTHVLLSSDDGLLHALEVGRQASADGRYDKIALGAWYLDQDADDYSGTRRSSNSGAYLIAERTVAAGLTCFAQLGFAANDRNQVGEYYGAGVHWTGFSTARPDDVLGLAVAHARNADRYRRFDPTLSAAETAVELTWRAQLRPWLAVQPDVQYVVDPGMNRGLDDALVFSLRLELSF